MRYREFKKNITEATLAGSTPTSVPGYINAVNSLLAKNQPIPFGNTGKEILQPEPNQKIDNLQSVIKGKVDGVDKTLPATKIFKSSDIKGDRKSYNKGSVLEGIFGATLFVRLVANKSIGVPQVIGYITRTMPESGSDTKQSSIAKDNISLDIKLKPNDYQAFRDPKVLNTLTKNISTVTSFSNQEDFAGLAQDFMKNKKVDSVKVIADGISQETLSKVDVVVAWEGNTKTFEYSVKTDDVKQFDQVGTGGAKDDISLEERWDKQEEYWNTWGIDISNAEEDFTDAPSFITAYDWSYQEAAKVLKVALQGQDQERKTIETLFKRIQQGAFKDQPNVRTVDFSASSYKVLNFNKLDDFVDKVNLTAIYKKDKAPGQPYAQPRVIIQDAEGREFLQLRLYSGQGKLTNLIEKGPLLDEIVTVKKVKTS